MADGSSANSRTLQQSCAIKNSYWFWINGQRFSVWQLLKYARYPSRTLDEFDDLDGKKWLGTPRSSRLRYKRFVKHFLETTDVSEVDICAALSAGICQPPATDVQEGLSETSSDEETHEESSILDDTDELTSIHADQSTLRDSPETAQYIPAPLPASVYELSNDRVELLDSSGMLNEAVLPAKRKLLLSEILDSFFITENVSQKGANKLLRDIQEEDAVMDLHSIPTGFRNRLKLRPATNNAHAIVGTIPLNNGKYHHVGLHEQMRKHLARVLEATFPDSVKPFAPTVWIDAWTDGTTVAETGSKIHVYPLSMRFIAVGVWDDDPSRRKMVPVPEKLAFMPLAVGVFVGSSEPEHPEALLHRFVYELIMLDPRPRTDREKFPLIIYFISLMYSS